MRSWRGPLVAILTLALLYVFIWGLEVPYLHIHLPGLDFPGLLGSFRSVRLLWFSLSVTLYFLHFVIRAWRWDLLLRPLGRSRFSDLFAYTTIGYALNNILPARVGEIARPLLLSRKTGLSAAGTIASVLLERILDLLTILVLFGASLPFLLPLWLAGAQREKAVSVVRTAAQVGVVAAAAILFALLLLKLRNSFPSKYLAWMLALLPSRTRYSVAQLGDSFLRGLRALATGRLVHLVGATSLLLWLDLAGAYWAMAHAFGVDLTWPGAFFMNAILAMGMAIPTPGGVGGYDAFCKYGLTIFFGVDATPAGGIAILSHLAGIVPVTLVGLVVFFLREGLSFGSVRALAAPGENG